MPALKLHIAGHTQGEEEPKLASQRAQAVGAALIALGAKPSRLRAKGYGGAVTLSAAMKARLRLKSERRVSVHPISEVGTRHGCEFEATATEINEQSKGLLAEVATLMGENPELRLSVEGHTDDRGDPNENGKLVLRAQSAVALEAPGVHEALVPHGFVRRFRSRTIRQRRAGSAIGVCSSS